MKGFINIEINNSFNKKDSPDKNGEDIFNNTTLNKQKGIMDTNSISVGSITNNQELGNILIPKVRDRENKSIFKEIFIGVVSAVLGSIITYLILGIK